MRVPILPPLLTMMLASHAASAVPPIAEDVARALARVALERSTGATATTTLDAEVLAKAAPDECFDGVGNPYPPGPPCATGRPKVNQAYVWGLAKSGPSLWFGTAPNVHCLVLGAYLGQTAAIESGSYVCELGDSPFVPPLPAAIGDWRPPRIFTLDLATGGLVDRTPNDVAIQLTVGLRSAGTVGDVVLLGGPNFSAGINLFAFQASTGAYLGSASLPYFNIRKWISVNGVLYTAAGPKVLRYRGDVANPFDFEEVGDLTGDCVELASHEGRLFVSTWPPGVASLWMSEAVPSGGLTAQNVGGWQRVWQCTDYEPDALTAATYGGGALVSFDGYLYWGTMHVPFMATVLHFGTYGQPTDPVELLEVVTGRHRAISIFRGRDFATSPRIELLYGEAALPVYDPTTGWQQVANRTGPPLFGASGFGNFFNNYTWTMAVFDGQLYVGTMDWSYLLGDMIGLPPGLLPYGADLWRFPSAADPAVAESTDGVGNYTSYGIRTMLADRDLFLGMANPMNLLTDPTDTVPEGGWELLRLASPRAEDYVAAPGPAGANPARVRILSGATVVEQEWSAYGTGGFGANIASADIDGGDPEVLTGPGPGAVYGPHVRAFRTDGSAAAKVSFYAYGTLRFGANVTAGDVDGDGHAELLTGAGPGAIFGPHVRGFDYDGQQVAALGWLSFYGFGTLRYGVNVASGDVDGDQLAELVAGPGPGAVFGAQARGFGFDAGSVSPINTINGFVFAGASYGLRTGLGDVDRDGADEGLFGPGPGPTLAMEARGFELQGGPMSPLPGLDATVFGGLHYGLDATGGDLDVVAGDDVLCGQGPDPAASSRVRGFVYRGGVLLPVAAADFDAFTGLAYGARVEMGSLRY